MDDVERDSLEPLHSNVRIDDVRELEDAADLFVETFRESVRKRLIADVPVGIFLSGGLDSAAITAFAAELAGPRQRINTYTVGYPGAKVSELANARRVVERFNTHHREIVLSESHLEALPFVAAAMGEPVGDSAALPTYFLSLAAKQTSTVVLTGEGSDELFFGYPRYLMHDIADDVGEGSLRSRLVASLPFAPFTRLRHVLPEPWNRDRLWKGLRPDAFGIPVDPPSDPAEPNAAADPSTAADWSRADDITRWLPEAVLTRIDRMTMAASIEARAPFLAREVARLGLHLRPSFLRRFPYGKMVVRRALQPYLGIRKSLGIKRAFAVPLVQWLNGPLRATTRDVFFGPRLSDRGWFDAAALRAIGEAILRNDESASRLGWTVIAIELWARAHVDRQAPSEERPLTFDVGAG
jgi:asparagine synthase (glutamine-hydrolysing)